MRREKMADALLRCTVPFAAAMLLLCLTAIQPTQALFAKKAEQTGDAGAPIAQDQEIRVFRDIPYTGTLYAVDREGGGVSFAITAQPKRGTLELEGDTFYYVADRLGTDSFSFTAEDAEGNISKPAQVKITIVRSRSGVAYSDMAEDAAYTAAVDLADRGVIIGTQVGKYRFFEPQRSVSRGEFTAMALSAVHLAPDDITLTGFCDDESIPSWAKGYAVSALRSGAIRGVGTEDGIAFCADDAITMNEAAAVLDRLLDITDVTFAEEETAAAWSAQAVADLRSVGIIPSGSFSQEEMSRPLTRSEAAELLSAAALLAEKKSGGLLSGLFK